MLQFPGGWIGFYFEHFILPILVVLMVVIVMVIAYKLGVVDRKTTESKILVICPYCGTKNEQGITICRKCGGEL